MPGTSSWLTSDKEHSVKSDPPLGEGRSQLRPQARLLPEAPFRDACPPGAGWYMRVSPGGSHDTKFDSWPRKEL